jgi:hypothetical protein
MMEIGPLVLSADLLKVSMDRVVGRRDSRSPRMTVTRGRVSPTELRVALHACAAVERRPNPPMGIRSVYCFHWVSDRGEERMEERPSRTIPSNLVKLETWLFGSHVRRQ